MSEQSSAEPGATDDGPPSPATSPRSIEPKWQQYWRDHGTYEVDNDDPRPRYYVLCMYPYPSGAAHMGHVRNYTFGDLLTRYRTMRGDAVLSPMGFDCFGLPAENAAIKTGRHPRGVHRRAHREAAQLASRASAVCTTGAARSRATTPSYIRWTQWIFLKFLEAGLAYRKAAPVNWCPGRQTVLANEQVLRRHGANAPATWWRGATSSSGTSASPTTPSSCSTTWTGSTGPSG